MRFWFSTRIGVTTPGALHGRAGDCRQHRWGHAGRHVQPESVEQPSELGLTIAALGSSVRDLLSPAASAKWMAVHTSVSISCIFSPKVFPSLASAQKVVGGPHCYSCNSSLRFHSEKFPRPSFGKLVGINSPSPML